MLVTAPMWMSEDGFWEGVFFYHVDSGISADLATSTFACEPSHRSVYVCIWKCLWQCQVLKVTSPCGCPVSPAQFVKEIVFCLFSHVCFDTFVKNLASGAVWVYVWVLDPTGQCVSVCCRHTGCY